MRSFSDFGVDVPPGARGEVRTICPECSHERRKSSNKCLAVNVDAGTWFCHHCFWKGGLGERAEWTPPALKTYQPPRPVPSVVAPTLWQNAVTWFAEQRGISADVLARNNIAATTAFCPECDKERSFVLFPYRRDGAHVNTKHRCVAKHFRMEKGAERILYGLDDVKGNEVCIWVEGEIDKLSVEMAGFTNCVSVPDGAPTPGAKSYSSKFDFLDSAKATLDAIPTHILICDEDAPGYALTEELSRRLGREKCRRGTFPDGIKDANECLTKIGAAELARVITDAEPYPIEGVTTFGDLAADLSDLYANGFDEGIRVGWPKLDQLYRVRPGLMTVITGIPSHGKSSWLDQLLVEIVAQHGWAVAVCSPENQPIKRHAAGLIAKYARLPFHDGLSQRMTADQAAKVAMLLDRHIFFVLPEEPTLEAILGAAKALVYQKGIKGLVIDPWNEVEHFRPPHMTETEYVGKALSQIRRFARAHDVHVWIVAHPTKLSKKEDGSEAVPTLYDINGSANFRNKADYGLSVWRDIGDQNMPNQVHVIKVRFQETGRPGVVDFWYDHPTQTFREDRANGVKPRS